jgi:TolB-like protein/DNA-binding winged helix-turn-helix (wHTH) protein
VVDTVFEFGEFRLDCGRFELYRGGRSLKLERKPLELLILLVGREGRLVTRNEIAQHLWGSEVFVDTEHGINTAIRKIRYALRDDPEHPRFVQTVTGKGYRFVATAVEARESLADGDSQSSSAQIGPAIPDNAEQPSQPPASYPRSRIWIAVLGALTALVFLIAAVNLGARGWRNRFRGDAPRPEISSLAVLPLDNLSGDPSQDYFADGMTDELTTMLAKNSTLRIISRTSVMQYKGVHRPLPQITRELGVDGVLEGSVVRSRNKVHMTIQLIQSSSDTHVWAESYDRDIEEAGSLPREAAQTIARQLSHSVGQGPLPRYVSPEAHDAYLRGRYLWFRSKLAESGKYFNQATELQPDYALGWSGLSVYYSGSAITGELKPEESLAPAYAAAMKAVALDDSLPEAHLALAAALLVDRWDREGAEREVNRAIELDPKFAEAYHLRAKILAVSNRQREALASQKQATELDPFSKPIAMPMAFKEARQYDAGINDVRQRLEGDPQNAALHWYLYDFYRCKGMKTESAEMLEKAFLLEGDQATAGNLRRAFQQGGYKGLIRWQLTDLNRQSATHYVSPLDKATFTAELGDREQTIALLEEGYRHRVPGLLWAQNEPAFDSLHSDERYRTLIKGMGLPPAY